MSAHSARLIKVVALFLHLQNLHKLRGKIGFLPQDSFLPPQERVENIALYFCHLAGVPKNQAKKERNRILQLVNLQDAARNQVKELSHGMYKRLCLAQAIAGKPQLIFLDEPTAGLDPTQTLRVKAIIQEHLQGATVVISSHQLEQLEKLCTHGAIIHEGKIVASGSMDELTGKNQQLKIELAPQTSIALEKLASHLPQYSFSLNDRFLECLVPHGLSVEDAIHATVSHIFADGGRILGIERGGSLESFYLATTQKS